MHIVNALTRAYPKNSIPKVDEQSQFCHQVEDLILTEHLPISTDSLDQFGEESTNDMSLQVLMQVMLTGLPEQK